ncbi:PE-PPE domain-containing protein [Mycobacterium sp. TY814]|uniref:PE-PPE domain-containing protein n=1 Tax=unclassified Mycobacterium TaxID=2642494 RepID=UPI002741B7E9|nr:PE-PPE domain-containing protein [Mycobacterium sp. TY814]MDP7723718.1 PE-PPE domain-containing protein [Mycobacterium sp. TY814]
MSVLALTPEALASAATDLQSIRSALDEAQAAAASPTTTVLAAAADEVSDAVATLFTTFGQDFQVLSAVAGEFHQGFVRALNAGARSYLNTELLNASLLQPIGRELTALFGSPAAALLGRPMVGTAGTVPTQLAVDYATLIMGGTGNPVPDSTYLNNVYNAYIAPRIAPNTAVPTGLTTPEQGWPLTGLRSLTFDTSIAQGVEILKQAIAAQPPGTNTTVFGFSQSSTIITNYLQGIANGSITNPPNPADLRFVLTGNPNNPNGGLFQRFVGLYIPGFNETFGGATPNLAYPTDIYTIQYDGFAHFPRYPLNVLSVANAVAGLYYDHLSPTPTYSNITPEQLASAIVAPVSPGTNGATTYYFIPTQDLPLLRPLNLPQPLLNIIQPPLRVLVDLGYGDIGGPYTEYANLPTPASLFPLVNPVNVGTYLVKGAVQGVQANLVWAGLLPPDAMPDTYPFVASPDPGLTINLGQPSVTSVSATTTGLGTLLRALNIPPFGAG